MANYLREADSLLPHIDIQNEPGLKIFFSLYDEKLYPVHKRTESRPEIAFYNFFKGALSGLT